MAVGDIYIPLQICGKPATFDLDMVQNTKYGRMHLVVEKGIIVKEEMLPPVKDKEDGMGRNNK